MTNAPDNRQTAALAPIEQPLAELVHDPEQAIEAASRAAPALVNVVKQGNLAVKQGK